MRLLVIFLLFLMLLLAGTLYLLMHAAGPEQEIQIVIPKGSGVREISATLKERGLIRSEWLFQGAYLLKHKPLQAGEYHFPPYTSSMKALRMMSEGEVFLRRLTIPEGLMTSSILALVDTAEGLTGTVPETVEEGILLPETYSYTLGDAKASILKRMQDAQSKLVEELWSKRSTDLPYQTVKEFITMASIIEKETGVTDERPRVSGVFFNRLKQGMALQTDPTVVYAVTEGKYVLKRPLSLKDLKTESPYNTYLHTGLPPGPICNPGQKSLEAALNPLATNELYFVADGKGGHRFSASLQEHNRNVNLLRQLERQN